MIFPWLKRYMPRSLYGRAALILILPVAVLQIVVAVAFAQRHFDGVTEQMSRVLAIELRYLTSQINNAAGAETAVVEAGRIARALDMELTADPVDGVIKGWSDISGITIARVLNDEVPKLSGINLALEPSLVGVTLSTDHGLFTVTLDRRRLSPKNPHQLFVWMVAIGAVMLVISYMFLRNQLRPVKRLAVAAAAFGRGQVVSLTPTGATEMHAAGTAFLDMRARIERQAQQRRLMLSGISHDLRTPLTRMRLGLSLMDEDTSELEGDVDAMQQMLDAFLNFARDEGTEETEIADLGQLITDAIQQSQRAGFDVTAIGAISTASMPLRPMAIGRLLDNLISNGAKYGTRVGVSLAVSERSVCITIEDDGPGIEPEFYDTALRPFTRLEGGRNQNKVAGVGLGLAIANDIVRSHGGSLRLGVSDALGGLRVDVVLSRPAPN